jgi:hypothetical protein
LSSGASYFTAGASARMNSRENLTIGRLEDFENNLVRHEVRCMRCARCMAFLMGIIMSLV